MDNRMEQKRGRKLEAVLEYLKKQYDGEDRLFVANLGDYKTIVISKKPIAEVSINWSI